MKAFFSVLIVVSAAVLVHQESTGQGTAVALGFVNAVGLETKTDVKVDGSSLKPAGFNQGSFVEGFGLPEGKHHFSFLNGTCDAVAQDIDVKPGPSPLYVLYAVPLKNPDGTAVKNPDGTVKNKLKLITIPPQTRSRGCQFFGFYASESPATTFRANDSNIPIKGLQLIPLGQGRLTVQTGVQPVRYQPIDSGNYVLVVFDGSDSHLHQSFVQMAE